VAAQLDDVEAQIGAHLDAADHAGAVTIAIRGYGPELLSYVYAVVRDEANANDVFSIACEDMWRGIAGFRRESSFRTWAYQLSWHAAARFLRDPRRKRAERLGTDAAAKLAAEVRSTTALHLRKSSKDALDEIRAALPPDEQTMLILRIDRELGWAEVAGVLGETEPTLRKRFERLTSRLREQLRARGLLQ
jgi:RNA polymerase sigma-70 factor, ECF subfamily